MRQRVPFEFLDTLNDVQMYDISDIMFW